MTTLEMAAATAAIRFEFEQYRTRIWAVFEKHLRLAQRVNGRTADFGCILPDCEGSLVLGRLGRIGCTCCAAPGYSSRVVALADPDSVQVEYDAFTERVWESIESAAGYEMKWRNADLWFDCLKLDCPGTLHLDGGYNLHCTHCVPPNSEGCLGRHEHPCPARCGHNLHIDCTGEVRCEHCDGLCGLCNEGPEPSGVPFAKLSEIEDYLGMSFANPDGVDNDEAVDAYLNVGKEAALVARLLAIKTHLPQSRYVHFDEANGGRPLPCYPCPGCQGSGTLFLNGTGLLYCDDRHCAVNAMELVNAPV